MRIADRLRELRKGKGLTVEKLCAELDFKLGTYRHYESGDREPGSFVLLKLSHFYGVTVDYLILGTDALYRIKGPEPLTPPAQRIGRAYEVADPPVKRTVEVALEPYMDKKIAPSKMEDANIDVEPEPNLLKLYSQPAAAGLGNYLDDDDYELVDFPDAPIRANIAVRISGDSMEPDYQDGDIVFVETESVLRDGEVGIFNYDGNGYIKVLRIDPPRLESVNAEYDDIYINTNGDIAFQTIGRVVGVAE